MADIASFDIFMRSAFGVEPSGRAGLQLESLAVALSLPQGRIAPLDRGEDHIVYVTAGATKLAALASGNREQVVAFHFGGDIFSIAADGLHAYVLTSLLDTDLLVFPAREFLDCAARDARIARALLERQRTALHRCRDKAVALGRKNALERLAGFLVTMSERVGSGDMRRRVLHLAMSRRDIGDSLGLTIETVSRQLGVLRDAGLIETSGRSQIVLRDLAALARQAGHFEKSATLAGGLGKFDLDQCDDTAPRLTGPATGGLT